MLYIDKSNDKKKGDSVTKDYLINCCFNKNFHRYQDICYDERDGKGKRFLSVDYGFYKDRMINVLYKNQYGYCCYCLRKLRKKTSNSSIDKISIEHIIPRGYNSSNTKELTKYQRTSNLDKSEIILRENFEKQINPLFPPFPHNVAYNNLVLSCLGTFPDENRSTPHNMCCNIVRKDNYAFPAYYLPDIQQYIYYKTDGTIFVKKSGPFYEDIYKLVGSTKLFIRSLNEIRRLWYELRYTNYRDIYSCRSIDERHELLSSKLISMTLEDKKKFISKFIKDDYWKTFMLYHKFYSIMKRLYP